MKITPTSPLFQTAVLFLVFNRPDLTAQVFETIRKAKPPRLYIAADGARPDREGEANRVDLVRKIVTDVDWPCKVTTLFRNQNLGCKKAVSEAIDWFFENEKQGIILEDDCLPHPHFFIYCEELLNRYANDERIWVITGDNFQGGQLRGDASYYFSRYNHVWGWASWRRAWAKRDMSIKFWPKWKQSSEWATFLPSRSERKYWSNIFDSVYRDQINSWGYPWTATVWFYGGLTVTPNVNLISNIGFGADATHTFATNSPLSAMPVQDFLKLKHPSTVQHDILADLYAFDHVFGGRYLRFPYVIFYILRRFADRIYMILKKGFF
jgi:hypothetical protein